jgi:hypothetical protein
MDVDGKQLCHDSVQASFPGSTASSGVPDRRDKALLLVAHPCADLPAAGARDPERPVADDRQNVPGTPILFVGGINRTDPWMALADQKITTEPINEVFTIGVQ